MIKRKETYYANTSYGYVSRTSRNQYHNWCLIVTKSHDGHLLASISFHKQGNIQKRPSDALVYESGEVTDRPKIGLSKLEKKGSEPWGGWIVLDKV